MEILLRRWREEDVPQLLLCANDPLVALWLRDGFPSPYTEEAATWFINHGINHTEEQCYAIALEDQAIGSISYRVYGEGRSKAAEIGYWLGSAYWNKGYGSQAVAQIVEKILEDAAVEHISAEVFADNTASRRLLEKCNFTLMRTMRKAVQKDGAYLDACYYQYTR